MTIVPRLSRSPNTEITNGIVHLGVGAFFRAHGAMYISESMEHTSRSWGVVGVSLRRPDQRDKLQPQQFAYTTVEQSDGPAKIQNIDVITDVLVAPENPKDVINALANSGIHLVTMTITEKGYCRSSGNSGLDFTHEDIAHDLANLDRPISAIGFLVAALAQRKADGLRPFTILSCDNLPENGKITRQLVIEFAAKIDGELATWIEEECCFPCSMVDRIVPATTAEDIARVEKQIGFYDASPVVHEPFRQWVIEDSFVDNKRPPFEKVGVQLVDDVLPFETMKLRCLNGTHSALAYLGYLAGHETISCAVSDAPIRAFTNHLWGDEIIPAIEAPCGVDLDKYCASLMERYENTAIQHKTWQIAMDGSHKLPQRILATIENNLRNDLPVDGLCLTVAAWMKYTSGTDLQGTNIDVRDPLSSSFKHIADNHTKGAEIVDAYLNLNTVFSTELSKNTTFRSNVESKYMALIDNGVASAINGVLA